MQLNPYLTFDGNCAEALAFYGNLFETEVAFVQKFGEMPGESPFPDDLADRVMHARLPIGNTMLMASDHGAPTAYEAPRGFSMQLAFDTFEEAARIFAALAEGGEITMAFEKTFWAAGFGMCRDSFGIPWMVNCDNAS